LGLSNFVLEFPHERPPKVAFQSLWRSERQYSLWLDPPRLKVINGAPVLAPSHWKKGVLTEKYRKRHPNALGNVGKKLLVSSSLELGLIVLEALENRRRLELGGSQPSTNCIWLFFNISKAIDLLADTRVHFIESRQEFFLERRTVRSYSVIEPDTIQQHIRI
jgi:hypothetical protein